MSYFVTGTDTGVGKTLVSCALLHAFAARGLRAIGMKPVAAGCDENGQNEDVEQLRAASNVAVQREEMNPYLFHAAAAPHLAAQSAGIRIGIPRILSAFNALASKADMIVVEGAGGFKVPLNENEDSAELAVKLALPVIMVVGLRLGCLNHALLTREAIESRGLAFAGWVANAAGAQMPAQEENIDALKKRLDAPLLGSIPHQDKPDARFTVTQLNMELLKTQ
jgi:dethiobiotin synthetase